MNYKGLPIYQMVLGEDTDGVNCVSIVSAPAIESDFMLFSESEKQVFSKADEDKKVIFGAAMIPDLPIYRVSPSGEEYYITFSKETVAEVAKRFNKNGFNFNLSLEHAMPIDSAYVFESFLKDSEKGISPKGFESLNEGTWFLSVQVTDDSLWEELKKGDFFKGFSVEIMGQIVKMSEQKTEKKDWLENILKGNF